LAADVPLDLVAKKIGGTPARWQGRLQTAAGTGAVFRGRP